MSEPTGSEAKDKAEEYIVVPKKFLDEAMKALHDARLALERRRTPARASRFA